MERNLCLLIFFTCSIFASENFWFSYKVATDNRQVVFEERNISPQMQTTDTKKYKFFCKIDVKKKNSQSIEHFLNKNFDKLLDCFYPMSSKVTNYTLIETKGMIERTVLTIIPTKFTVDFKDDFANINVLR